MSTAVITLEMMATEQKRLLRIMEKSYPGQVAEGKITPYERDHRLNIARKLIYLLDHAIKRKNEDEHSSYFETFLNQQPAK
jgi:hypothetical protein